MQKYEPYRKILLNRGEIESLQKLNPIKMILNTLLSWSMIFAALYCAKLLNSYWIVPFISIFIGLKLYGLLIIAHDGLHRRLFNSIRVNDNWNDMFILGAFGAITRINRLNHIRHHKELALVTDPDRFKYSYENRNSPLRFIIQHTCVPLIWVSLQNVLLTKKGANNAVNNKEAQLKKENNYKIRDLLIIVVWQLSLIFFYFSTFGFWGYLLLWIFPVYIALCCDITRVFCEHSDFSDDFEADLKMRLVSFDVNLLESFIFAPFSMNHHIAHHLWPSIPYYNLKKAEELIRTRVQSKHNITWRRSYFMHIINYFIWLSRK